MTVGQEVLTSPGLRLLICKVGYLKDETQNPKTDLDDIWVNAV